MIGKDFPPNDFLLFGLDFTDPTDFIYDVILGVLALYYSYRISKFSQSNIFFSNWKNFYLYFGLATLLSAFGHLFYNYFHYVGKIPGWTVIPVSTYWIGRAVLSAHKSKKVIKIANILLLVKLFTTYLICFVIWLNTNPIENPQLLFLPIAVDTIIGLLAAVGFYSFKFNKEISSNFKYILLGIIIIIPSAFIFILKINLHQWFSKNDFSHVLMVFAISFFFYGVNRLQKEQFFLSRNKK